LISILIKTNKRCQKVIGNFITDDTSVESEDTAVEPEKELDYWNDVDGDIASTESDDEIVSKEEPKEVNAPSDKPKQELFSDTADQKQLSVSEAKLVRFSVLQLCSHQNNDGNTMLHEAVSEDRFNFVDSIKMLNLVNPDLRNNKGFTYEELNNFLKINSFIRRYKDIENEIRNRRQRKRR